MSDGPVRLTRRLAPWFDAAFRARAMNEDVTWDITLGIQARSDGPPAAMLLIIASLPAAVLGHAPHTLIGQLPALGLNEEVCARAAGDLVTQLLQMRAQELSTTNGGGKPVTENKLIIPGA